MSASTPSPVPHRRCPQRTSSGRSWISPRSSPLPTAYLAIGYANSILSPKGAQAAERLWERGRMPGGAIGNTVKLVHAVARTATG